MKQKVLFVCLLIFSFLIFFGCKPPAYVPNKINAPFINEKYDFTADAGIGVSGLNIQAAFSPVKHLGIMANFSTEAILSKENNSRYNKVDFGELGAGYYLKFGKLFLFDLYGGGGMGFSKIVLDTTNRTDVTNVNYYRLFAQPSFAFTTNVFKLDLACRFNYINAYKSWGPSSNLYHGSLFCYEPAITAKLGYKWIMVYLQWAYSLPFKDIDSNIYMPSPWSFTGGISFSFNFGKKSKN